MKFAFGQADKKVPERLIGKTLALGVETPVPGKWLIHAISKNTFNTLRNFIK